MIDKRIIILGGDNPNMLGVIRTLGEKEIGFVAIIIKSTFVIASKSKYLKRNKCYFVDNIEDAYNILIKIKEEKKSYLIVEGDLNTGFLDRKFNSLQKYYIWNNASEQDRLSEFLGKKRQVELAQQCGINVLPSIVVKKGVIPDDIEFPIITKAVTSEIDDWKAEVFVCNDAEDLKKAYKKIKSETIMLQKYIQKKNELCLDGFSIDGGKKQFIAIASTYDYLLDSGYSYHCTVFNCKSDKVRQEITKMMTAVGYEGIYSFEYIVDQDDTLYFLEINFRNSGWSYAATCLDMPLPILWIEAMEKGDVDYSKEVTVPAGYSFVQDFSDFKARAGKKMSLLKWIKLYKDTNCKLELGRNDILPFVAYVSSRLFRKMKKTLVKQ